MIGFTFNGIHSSTYNIVSKSNDRSLLPDQIKKEIIIPGKHGSYDFEDNTYSNRQIKIDISYIGNSIDALRNQMRLISAWLSQSSYCKLFFDDEPSVYYWAKVYSSASLTNLFRYGKTSITFECQPMAECGVSTGQDLTWSDDLIWGDNISWDNVADHTIAVTGNTTTDLEYDGTVNLGSYSQDRALFDIIITGSFTTLTLSLNGKSITYGAAVSSKVITIDNVNMTIKEGSTNKLSVCSGDLISFLHLIPGTNTVTITGTGLSCSILFDYRWQFI